MPVSGGCAEAGAEGLGILGRKGVVVLAYVHDLPFSCHWLTDQSLQTSSTCVQWLGVGLNTGLVPLIVAAGTPDFRVRARARRTVALRQICVCAGASTSACILLCSLSGFAKFDECT